MLDNVLSRLLMPRAVLRDVVLILSHEVAPLKDYLAFLRVEEQFEEFFFRLAAHFFLYRVFYLILLTDLNFGGTLRIGLFLRIVPSVPFLPSAGFVALLEVNSVVDVHCELRADLPFNLFEVKPSVGQAIVVLLRVTAIFVVVNSR